MNPDKLQMLAEAIYGFGWQSALARDQGRHTRTVQRWASGKCAIPDDLEGKLMALVDEKINYLLALFQKHKMAEKL